MLLQRLLLLIHVQTMMLARGAQIIAPCFKFTSSHPSKGRCFKKDARLTQTTKKCQQLGTLALLSKLLLHTHAAQPRVAMVPAAEGDDARLQRCAFGEQNVIRTLH